MTTIEHVAEETFDRSVYEIEGTSSLNGRNAEAVILNFEAYALDRTDVDDMELAGHRNLHGTEGQYGDAPLTPRPRAAAARQARSPWPRSPRNMCPASTCSPSSTSIKGEGPLPWERPFGCCG